MDFSNRQTPSGTSKFKKQQVFHKKGTISPSLFFRKITPLGSSSSQWNASALHEEKPWAV
jgi:hypothetical protein